jgi:hypothetical protein
MRQRFPFMYTLVALGLTTAALLALCSGCTTRIVREAEEPDGKRCLCLCKIKDTKQPYEEDR